MSEDKKQPTRPEPPRPEVKEGFNKQPGEVREKGSTLPTYQNPPPPPPKKDK